MIFQPADSPQLNPIERLWQFIKRQFKGESFSNLHQLCQRIEHQLSNVFSGNLLFDKL
ncbi:transposase [Nostoc sp. UHCC 0926]|uniref:transposase n=1 Tax=Nostoc sp. UHCC 0926 TaxID=3025190 RepID=UPI00236165E8|nr:transposase [Nostoc sp. UHCC 0926]